MINGETLIPRLQFRWMTDGKSPPKLQQAHDNITKRCTECIDVPLVAMPTNFKPE